MCQICKDVEAADVLDAEQTQKFLNEIGEQMKAGGLKPGKARGVLVPDHFTKALNKLLGTEMAERDPELEEAWEKKRRSA